MNARLVQIALGLAACCLVLLSCAPGKPNDDRFTDAEGPFASPDAGKPNDDRFTDAEDAFASPDPGEPNDERFTDAEGAVASPDSDDDWFTDAEDAFADPDSAGWTMRYLKDREGAPPSRRSEALEALYLPEADGFGSHHFAGHEFFVERATRLRFEWGNRLGWESGSQWELVDDAAENAPEPDDVRRLLAVVSADVVPDRPLVILAGFRRAPEPTIRFVLIGFEGTVEVEGMQPVEVPPLIEDGVPLPVVAYERRVPPPHAPDRTGSFYRFSTGRFGATGKFTKGDLAMQEPFHLSSWIHTPQGGGSSGGSSNDVRTHSMAGIDVRADGVSYSVQVNGEPADWRTFPYTYWTLRAAFQTAPTASDDE